MTTRETVKFPVEMTEEMRDELDRIAAELLISRVAVIRFACREYADRFFVTKRMNDKPNGSQEIHAEAA